MTIRRSLHWWERPLVSPHGWYVRPGLYVVLVVFGLATAFVVPAFVYILTHPKCHELVAAAASPATIASGATAAILYFVSGLHFQIRELQSRIVGNRLLVCGLFSRESRPQLLLVAVLIPASIGAHWIVWYVIDGCKVPDPGERTLAYVFSFTLSIVPALWITGVAGVVATFLWLRHYERRHGVRLIHYDPRLSQSDDD